MVRGTVLVDWSSAIKENGHHSLPPVGLATMKELLPAGTWAFCSTPVSKTLASVLQQLVCSDVHLNRCTVTTHVLCDLR